jgi:hypothetical protein
LIVGQFGQNVRPSKFCGSAATPTVQPCFFTIGVAAPLGTPFNAPINFFACFIVMFSKNFP